MEENRNTRYRFFINARTESGNWDNYVVCISKLGTTNFVNRDSSRCNYSYSHSLKIILKSASFREVGIIQAVNRIDPEYRKSFLDSISFKLPEVSEEIETLIIKQLKEKRAFNEDSALKVEKEDYENCLTLLEKGKIREFSNKFFLPKAELTT